MSRPGIERAHDRIRQAHWRTPSLTARLSAKWNISDMRGGATRRGAARPSPHRRLHASVREPSGAGAALGCFRPSPGAWTGARSTAVWDRGTVRRRHSHGPKARFCERNRTRCLFRLPAIRVELPIGGTDARPSGWTTPAAPAPSIPGRLGSLTGSLSIGRDPRLVTTSIIV